MISIVGFGRPKFANSKIENTIKASTPKKEKLSPEIKSAIDLLTNAGYKIEKA
jgi:hypothetical protein